MASQWQRMTPVDFRAQETTVGNPLKCITCMPHSDQRAEGVASMRGVLTMNKKYHVLLLLILAVGSIFTFHYYYNSKYPNSLQNLTQKGLDMSQGENVVTWHMS